MTTKIDVPPGTRYGLLTVIREVYQVSQSGKRLRMQECRCDCGNVTTVTTGNLVNRRSKSCGCLKANERTPSGLHIYIPDDGRRTIKRAEKLPRRKAVEELAKVCRVVLHVA